MIIGLVDGTPEQVDPSNEAVLGRSASKLQGQPFADIVHPDDLAPTKEAFERANRC